MSGWTALVDAAVVGTARASVPPPGATLAGLQTSQGDDRIRLLDLAATASRARRAGYRPAQVTAAAGPGPVEEDPRPAVSRAARVRLHDLISEGRTDLVIEWLRLLAADGRRPPDVLLPVLLTMATDSRRLRAVLAPVLGPLAGWLAAANPAWAWAAAAQPADPAGATGGADQAGAGASATGPSWTTGSRSERLQLLERTRRRDPAAARDLIMSTWSADPYSDRAAFISALAAGLSLADEDLLSQALADRRAEVRETAAGLLARLPDSAFASRATTRADASVQLTGPRLVVTPPAEATAEMIADGIDPRLPQATGRQAWLLRQVVAAAPARWWAGQTGLRPADLLAAAARTEWGGALQAGWTDAAVRDSDAAWIYTLLDRPLGAAGITVIQALSPADRDHWLAAHPGSQLFTATLEFVPAPWSAPLSGAARAHLAELAPADPGRSPEVRKLLRLAALGLEPPEAPAPDLAQVHPRLAQGWADMLSVLSIRAAMRRELTEEPTP
jgi:uncharacterized protein DUF5691